MREHSDWLIVILGSQSGQIFYSAIIFTSNGRTWVQMYVEIAKKVHILAPTDENIKQVIYLKSTKIGRQILKLFHKLYFILRTDSCDERRVYKRDKSRICPHEYMNQV